MKKFLLILLAALLFFAVVMPFKSSAEHYVPPVEGPPDANYNFAKGWWYIGDGFSYLADNSTSDHFLPLKFTSSGMLFDSIFIDVASDSVLYYSAASDWNWYAYSKGDGWTTSDAMEINILEEPTAEVLEFLRRNAIKYSDNVDVCDGSCKADDNIDDGLCQTCGKPFSLRETGYQYTHSVTVKTPTKEIRTDLLSDAPFTIKGYKYGTTYRITTSIVVNVIKYERDTGSNGIVGDWVEVYNSTSKNPYASNDNVNDKITASTFDWYESDTSSTIFFPLPLWAEMEQVTQGEMVTVLPTLGQTVKILVGCGVGLLAFIVLLPIFRKLFTI